MLIKLLLFVVKKNFVAPFYGWGSTASRLEPLLGGSLLFNTKFSKISGTHLSTSEVKLIDLLVFVPLLLDLTGDICIRF